jgi:hypothetical protein
MGKEESAIETTRMKLLRCLLPVAFPATLLLSGCASGPQVDPQITSAVSAAHVDSGTAWKIDNARPLDYGDIMNLAKAHVPSHISVGYLRSTQRAYNFTPAQLAALKAAGAKPHLINYLTETEGFYGPAPKTTQGGKVPKWIKNNSKLEQDQQPYYYNAPLIDDWYDSAYTESCYSPFSFDTGDGG